MPNLWKKKKGSSRISKLFSDLQTPPKRGGSLVVETGFPTSIIDLFVKNRDRLKKKKRPTTTSIEEKEEEKEVEFCLVSEIELEVEKNENKCAELDIKGNEVEGNDGNERLDRGILGNKVICMSGLMGLCVLCSKGFVAGLSIGAILLLLFEFVANLVVFQWVRCCLDVVKKLDVLKLSWVFDCVIRRGCGGSGSVRGVEGEFGNVVGLEFVDERDGCGLDVSDCDVKCEIEEVIELNGVCGMTENSGFDGVGECGNVSSKRGIVGERGGEKEGECSNVSSKRGIIGERGGGKEGECYKMVDENGKTKKRKKFWKRCVFKGISKKMKDNKQGKKTHQQSRELVLTTCIVSNNDELDEEGKRVEERKLDETNDSSLSSSSDKLLNRRMEEFGNGGNHTSHIGRRLHRQNITTKSCKMVVYRGLNFECLVVMVIVLVGLVDSRILALVLTLICCVGFKLMRRL